MPRVAALILAAGGSSRMGTAKQLLRYRDQSLLRRVAAVAIEAGCSPVRIVIGSSSAEMKPELAGLPPSAIPIEIIENENWPKGMGTSIRAGMAGLSDVCDAVLILLCDQPLITADHLRGLIDLHEKSTKPLCASAYPDASVGPPALFQKIYFPNLEALPDGAGAKRILSERPSDLATLPIPEAAIDLDTPQDYQRLSEGG